MPGSITVAMGQQVIRGQVIARCGNSGNTSEPHVHFQLNDGSSFFTSAGLPIRFKNVWAQENGKTCPAGYIVKGNPWRTGFREEAVIFLFSYKGGIEMNDQTLEKLAQSLTGDSADIIPFLPYLLQDLWELGSSPQEMLSLIKNHIPLNEGTRVLDLGCGKGAVAIRLAQELGCCCKGIDLLPGFDQYAKEKAAEYGVNDLCEFTVGDVVEAVQTERGYDLVIYGAVGNILGSPYETLQALADTIKPGGHILLDDAYLEEGNGGAPLFQGDYPTLSEWKSVINEAGLKLAALHTPDEENPSHAQDLINIKRRAEELSRAYPSKREWFARYVRNQQNEYADLESSLMGVVFLLNKVNKQ